MRPVLIALPSKLLFAAALILAAVTFARDLWRRRRDPGVPLSSTPLYLLGAAEALLYLKGDAFLPSAAAFAHDWSPVPIYAYGVMLGTSLIVGWFVAMRFAKEDGIPTDTAASIYMWTAVWSIIGSRLLYVVVQWREFSSFWQIFMVNRGGLVAYGGMIGGFLASVYACKRRKVPLLQWADAASPSVVLGTGITRIGCFLFGCDFGRRTSLPWGIEFPRVREGVAEPSPAWILHHREYNLPTDSPYSYAVHPTQLYEMLVGFGLFALLVYLRKRRKFSGQVFLGWVLGYGIMRPLIEILREDDQRGTVGPLSTSQFIGIVAVGLGLALLVALVRRHRRDPESLRLWQHPVMAGGGPAPDGGGERGPSGGGKPRRKKRR